MNEVYALAISQLIMWIATGGGLIWYVLRKRVDNQDARFDIETTRRDMRNQQEAFSLKIQNDLLERDNKNVERIASLREQLIKTKDAQIELTNRLHEQEKIIERGRQESDRMIEQNRQLTKQLETQEATHVKQMNESRSAMTGYAQENKRLLQEVNNLKAEVGRLKTRLSEVENSLRQKDETIASLTIQNQQKDELIAALTSERDTLRDEMTAIRDDVDTINNQIDQLDDQEKTA